MAVDEYTIAELAELGGVSRRTVRYYVQEGLIPPPAGLGRGAHYHRDHLEALLRVKSMQERGLMLEEIRLELTSGKARAARAEKPLSVSRSHWSRIEVLPGLEIHVESRRQLPPPGQLEELLEWCRAHFRNKWEDHDD
jgi:DNA-binding transcriptional MerR regulator